MYDDVILTPRPKCVYHEPHYDYEYAPTLSSGYCTLSNKDVWCYQATETCEIYKLAKVRT